MKGYLVERDGEAWRLRRLLREWRWGQLFRAEWLTRARQRYESRHFISWHYHRQALSHLRLLLLLFFLLQEIRIRIMSGLKIKILRLTAERAELVPVVTAREDAAQAEDDDQEERCPQRKSQRRPRCVGVVPGHRRVLRWALHHLLVKLEPDRSLPSWSWF